MEKEQDIIIPKEIEFNIEFELFELDEIMWIKLLNFLIHSLEVPEEYWNKK